MDKPISDRFVILPSESGPEQKPIVTGIVRLLRRIPILLPIMNKPTKRTRTSGKPACDKQFRAK